MPADPYFDRTPKPSWRLTYPLSPNTLVSMKTLLLAGLTGRVPVLPEKRFLVIISVIAITLLAGRIAMAQDAPDRDVLAGLDKGHPRLMLKDADLQRLKKHFETDLTLQKVVGDVLAEADACLLKPPLEYSKMSERWECMQRICALGLAWRWTGDEKYARCAKETLLTVCAFPDWQPPYSLHTAELLNAFGIGYDWLYPYLTDAERQTIRENIVS
jgi:hypothetical protein